MLDHLVYAAPNLEEAIAGLAQRLGVEATPGGKHPLWGTKNALISLGPDTYLEIIGPDPDAPKPDMDRPFGIDGLKEPRLVTWAAKAEGIDKRVESARAQGYDPGPVVDGSRKTPHGDLLQWRLTLPQVEAGDGLIPFLIEWGDCEHPAPSAVQGCTLESMRAAHPNPEDVAKTLNALGIELQVQKETDPALIAILKTPKDRVELR